MSKGRKGLGKGLNALIPEVEEELNTDNVLEIDIQRIFSNKEQPRKDFDEEKLKELSKSIKRHGIIQPIIVSKSNEGFQIVAGERRWKAAMKAGIEKIPVIIKDATEEELIEISLIENLQRENLNDIEEAIAYKQLMEKYGINQTEIAERLGKSRVAIANTLRLLQLSDKLQALLKDNVITAGHARAILSVDPKERDAFAKKIVSSKMSVRQAETYSSKLKNKPNEGSTHTKNANDKFISDIEERIQKSIGTKVKIKYKDSKGKIQIDYYSDEDLERIVEILTKQCFT